MQDKGPGLVVLPIQDAFEESAGRADIRDPDIVQAAAYCQHSECEPHQNVTLSGSKARLKNFDQRSRWLAESIR
jgi:hypothetical protein